MIFFKKKLSLNFVAAILTLVIICAVYSFFNFKNKGNLNTFLKNKCKDCNVVLVVVDTLRQDHLTPYGYSRNTTPFLDELSKKSLVFLNNYSASNWTLPSMASMLSGAYPQHHLVNNKYVENSLTENASLDKSAPHLMTIAQYFKESGYHTAGFTGGAGVSSNAGFDKGFDLYFDDKDFVGFETTATQALDWLKDVSGQDDDRHFLFLHGYDVHGQYVNTNDLKPDYSSLYEGDLKGTIEEHVDIRDQYQTKGQILLNEEDKQFLIDRYDDKISAMDERLRSFLSKYYEELQFKNPTIFIITSDHGEEWFDHGGIDHGLSLYQEVVKTPLIIHFPGQEEQFNVKSRTSAVDLLPSILELVQISQNKNLEIDGTSFVSAIGDFKTSHKVLFHSDYRHATSLRAGINQGNEKIIVNLMDDQQQIYDLNKDVNEEKNLALKNNGKRKSMIEWLGQFFWELNL